MSHRRKEFIAFVERGLHEIAPSDWTTREALAAVAMAGPGGVAGHALAEALVHLGTPSARLLGTALTVAGAFVPFVVVGATAASRSAGEDDPRGPAA